MVNPFNHFTQPNCYMGHQYAEDVLSGKIVACKYVIGACRRYLKDLQKSKEEEFPTYYFNAEKAEHYLRTVQKFEHVIGVWDPPQVIYEPWQNFMFMNIMGWYSHESGFRKYRVAHIEVARGAGKSLLASQAALYFLSFDNPVGNKIACLATRKEQARIVLDSAREMAKKNESYRRAKGVQVLAHKIIQESTFSEVRALSSDQNGLDGLNDALGICDELHAMKKEVFEVIYSGMSKRRDSLLLCITTAGFSTESIGYSQSTYAKKVATGEVQDEQFFAMVFTLDDEDNIFDENVWIKANPNLGVSVDPLTFRAKVEKAKVSPADISNLKVKHFNIWLSEAKAFFDQAKWDLCADPTLTEEQFRGHRYYEGVDLASKVDLASRVKIFRKKMEDGKQHYFIFPRSFLPEQTLLESSNTLYHECREKGYLQVTKGEAIDYDTIQKEVLEDTRKFGNNAVHFDPWNATQFAQLLLKDRVNMVEFRMNTANLSEPLKFFDALIREKRIHHNGDPLFRWCLGNVVCKEDAAGNVFPRKTHERLKIDPIIAAVMALAGWVQEEENESVYETRGIRVL